MLARNGSLVEDGTTMSAGGLAVYHRLGPLLRLVGACNALTLPCVLLALIVGCAIFGPSLVHHDPLLTDVAHRLEPPSRQHWLGTDPLGSDVLSRVIGSFRTALVIPVAAVFLSFVVGSALALTASQWGGWTERLIGHLCQTIMGFPQLLLALGLITASGASITSIILATAFVNLPIYIQLVRGGIDAWRDSGFVQAARLSGNTELQILGCHILPNVLPAMMARTAHNLSWTTLNVAALSFVGVGVRAPASDWGSMIAAGASNAMAGAWWLVVFPGIALVMTALAFNLLADGISELVDPPQEI